MLKTIVKNIIKNLNVTLDSIFNAKKEVREEQKNKKDLRSMEKKKESSRCKSNRINNSIKSEWIKQ